MPASDEVLFDLTTPFGDGTLVPVSLRGREAMSSLFEYEIDMVSADHALDPERILGEGVTLILRHASESPRYFHGIVRHFSARGAVGRDQRLYRMVVVPKLWLTTLRRNFRFFQEKSTKDIVEEVLRAIEGLAFDFRATGGTTQREYCVQYDETDFNFVSRLLEEEGLFYFFSHADGSHTMVIGDLAAHYDDCPQTEVMLLHEGTFRDGGLTDWAAAAEVISGVFQQKDYDFINPASDLKTEIRTTLGPAIHAQQTDYSYPGRYAARAVGTKLGEARIEAAEARQTMFDGAGSVAHLMPGAKTRLAADPAGTAQGFVCVSVDHDASLAQDTTRAGFLSYSNSFRAVDDQTAFRPLRKAERPRVLGPLTATVVGPSGEEIFCDRFGRIRVKFHWDLDPATDDSRSCWVRVAQMLAGRSWGTIFTPRIGMEVVVQFLNGDPDRPLVVGTVYNGDNMPPYGLPDNKTQSGIKTRSTRDGSAETFNELRFEDKAGSEEVYLHAEKDFRRVVENDDTVEIGHDQSLTIKNNRVKTIEDGNETITLKSGNRSTKITKGDDSLILGQGGRSVSLDGPGNDALTLAGGNATVTLKSGDYTLKASGGKVSVEAATSIQLKVGSSTLKISPSGIEMKATQVKIEGLGSVAVKGPMVKIDGSAVVVIKGGLTKIN